MKKVVTVLMLAVVLLIGGATADSKTTKKKSKARTTQSTSNDMWNGDIPTGKNLCTLSFVGDWSAKGFYKKGYKKRHINESPGVEKKGVCTIHPVRNGVCGSLVVTVYDSSKLNWLYQDIIKANAKYNQFGYIDKRGNVIVLDVCSYD